LTFQEGLWIKGLSEGESGQLDQLLSVSHDCRLGLEVGEKRKGWLEMALIKARGTMPQGS
jgi:hypothetical protein